MAILSSQLIASIPENVDLDRVDLDLANSMYSKVIGQHPERLLMALRTELLDNSQGEPFARAASPIWLTPLGEAANRTGFSTRTCRKIMHFLQFMENGDVGAVAANVLFEFGTVEEQGNYLLRNISNRTRTQFYVKDTDLKYLAENWLAGTSYIDMFTNLPAAKRSKAQVTPIQWASGVGYERISGQYDKFVEVLEYCFGNYLLWILRALAELSPFVRRSEAIPDWLSISDKFVMARQLDEAAVDNAIISDGLEG